MRGKAFRARVIVEAEEDLLKIVRLKIQNPRWHDVDKWIDDLAKALRELKKWWRWQKMAELKPCPFCGGRAKMHETTFGNNIDAYVVWCANRDCEVSPSTKYLRFRKEAIEARNRRAEDGK